MEINQLCWDFTEIDTELWTGIPSDAYTKKHSWTEEVTEK